MFLRRVTKERRKHINVFEKSYQKKKLMNVSDKSYQRKKEAH
jgi:hypothetical protein